MMNFILLTSAILNSDGDPIVEIGRNTLETAENTRFGIIALITFVVSIMTLVFSILTFISQKATQKNTSRLSKKSQDIILQNMLLFC